MGARVQRRLFLIALVALLGWAPAPADAAGANLTGRMAPDLTFATGINGIQAGQKLSQLRGDVIWVKFWVHNCPICLGQMPSTQLRHERWEDFGLRVITIVHKIDAAHAQRLMSSRGWTVPVVLDRDGALARRYRVQRRPTHYLIGADGRVVVSNRISESAIKRALADRRRKQVMPIPKGGAAAAQAVADGQTGTGLRLAEALGDEAFTARVRRVAEADLRAHARRAGRRFEARRAAKAHADLAVLQSEYEGTSLARLAAAMRLAVTTK